MMMNLPSWYEISGAQMPCESLISCRSSSSGSVTACPITCQCTMSFEWLMAIAGKYWNVELTM